MPNHVENDLYLSGPTEHIEALIQFIGADETPPQFDFSRLIPYPESWATMDADRTAIDAAGDEAGTAAVGGTWPPFERDAPQETIDAARAIYHRARAAAERPLWEAYKAKWGTDRDGYNSGGYAWCCANWGTKWGAYRVARRDYDNTIILTFQTAWSPPADAILAALQERFPTVTLTLEYFERGMEFCGGARWPSEEDYYSDDDDPPWYPGIKDNTWEYKGYRGQRGG